MANLPSYHDIRDNFGFLDNWEDRYAYIIDIGNTLPPYPEDFRDEAHKVRGCASQVWLHTRNEKGRLFFDADSDAHIVRGLIAIVLSLYSGKTPQEIRGTDAQAALNELKLSDHLTAQRSNGLAAMVARIRAEAEAVQ